MIKKRVVKKGNEQNKLKGRRLGGIEVVEWRSEVNAKDVEELLRRARLGGTGIFDGRNEVEGDILRKVGAIRLAEGFGKVCSGRGGRD